MVTGGIDPDQLYMHRIPALAIEHSEIFGLYISCTILIPRC